MSRRTIIIGDIHGCYDELCEVLERVGPVAGDRVISVGDLIVKGEKNREVLDLFSVDERFSAVIGNHDRALLRYWRGEAIKLKESQERTRVELEPDRERYSAYLNSLPFMIDLDTHLIVHAGVRPGVALKDQAVEDLTELRTLGEDRTNRVGIPWYEVYDGDKIALFGHWPASQPRRAPRAIGLDTGCVYGFQLTAYIIEAEEFISAKARRVYEAPKRNLS
ncbi:MAG: hypothetical protein QOC96_670 [Acidobacteriota bacterium]|jgi:diadenosine tetraphosphatase ApaH/serine/threonine PP2A family protein phosphatase|nr:hypothetical protein [Acidobacteriota bacterium]